MKRIFCFLSAAFCAALSSQALNLPVESFTLAEKEDSLIYELQAIEVVATVPARNVTPTTTTISKEDLSKNEFGLDVPSLLMYTPSVISTSESGIGIGGTSMRIRGTDATRISVTVNGMSLNDPDSHSMYWYDTPDLSGAAGKIQVIRGAGTTTNGTGAFGGAVSMSTAALSDEFNGDAGISYGSFNTSRQSVHLGSGLIGGHWIADLRLSHISSDGYVDRASTDMRSYMFQLARMDGGGMVKFVSFGGKTKSYLTYEGVAAEDMAKMGRTYHASGQYSCTDGPYFNAAGEHVNYFDDQTDNYLQLNNQLIFDRVFDRNWSLNAMAYYTYGNGFYRQYKDDAWLMSYDNLVATSEQADLIRRKNMLSNRLGANVNGLFSSNKAKVTFGAAWMFYKCPHYGTIDWIDGKPSEQYENFRWYENDVRKNDANVYVKADFSPLKGLSLHGELQYRLVGYKTWGSNDNYDWDLGHMQPVSVDKLWHFFNPAASVSYEFGRFSRASISFAMTGKEPTRADFTDRYGFSSISGEEPRPERLFDYEFAYEFKHKVVRAGVNFYYMQYRDQLVPTGIVNDSDDNLNVNVRNSFRRGAEITFGAAPLKWFEFGGNCTLSQNKIRDFDEIIGDSVIHHDIADIAYSPGVTGCAYLNFHVNGFEAVVRSRHIGKQFVSNGSHNELSLPSYWVADLDLGYTLPRKITKATIRIGLKISNFTNNLYCSYGYGGLYEQGDGTFGSWMYVFPQAPRNAIGNIKISF